MDHTSDASCMEALQLAGKIIMENGGETYRAEQTISMMGEGFGLKQVESFAVPSGLFISYLGEDGNPITSVKRVHRLARNLTRVDEANRISRQVHAGELTCSQALEKLRAVERMPGSFRGLAHPMISVRYGAHNVWIDHCLFEDFARVAVGITKGADCVTVSWCEFRITGQSNGHSLGSLIASGDDNWEDEDLLNVTFDHCLWRNVWSRVPMARFGTIHVLNNWYDCAGTVGINPRQNAEFLVEGCWFELGTNPLCRYKITETPPKAYVFRDNVHDPQFVVESLGEVSVPYACAVTDPARAKAEVGAFAGPTLRRPMQVGRRRGRPARKKD